jgi:hypothetical protein
MSIPTLSRIKTFCKKHPDFVSGGLRHLIFNEDNNGLAESGAILRIGRSIFIDEEMFFNWIRLGQKSASNKRIITEYAESTPSKNLDDDG